MNDSEISRLRGKNRPSIYKNGFWIFVTIFCLFGFAATAEAATVIFRSVSPSATSALATAGGSNALTISGSTATFGSAIPNNVGVGDAIQYDSDGNSSIDAIAFIHGRTDSTHYTVKNATGGTPTAVSGDTDWSIFRAYNSIYNANSFIGNSGIAAAVRSFDSGASQDLTVADQQWNFAMYGNGTIADGAAFMTGWTTGPSTYLRIYTATSTSEVGVSQRAAGKYDPTKYTAIGNGYGLILATNYAKIDGIQVNRIQAPAGSSTEAALWEISNNIVDLPAINASEVNLGRSAISSQMLFSNYNGDAGTVPTSGVIKMWNNIFSSGDATNALDIRLANFSQIFNNTFYNLNSVFFVGGGDITFKNNIIASTTSFYGCCGAMNASSDYNATTDSTIGYGSGNLGNTHDRLSQTFSFFDAANFDYHLTGSDSGARNRGVDLSADADIPFAIDLEGESRPQQSVWDIGADEYMPAPDTTPPGLSGESPSGGELASNTTSTTISLNTNENATCKYSTTANTAYGSMVNTFSTTGTTTHSTDITGISAGHVYHYYVRCEDGSSNANTSDDDITVVVADAGIVYADSCSVADVNTAYAYTEAGDTLKIPAGTCTGWTSAAGLGIGKAITVEGAGQGQTIIEIASTTGSYTSAIMPISAAATVKSLTVQTEATGNGGTAFAAFANGFHITDVQYIERTSSNTGYFLYATTYGLVDHNNIAGGSGSTELIFAKGPSDSWQTNNGLGKAANLFVENNTFSTNGYLTDCNANSRCVVRNNTITGQQKIDGHGKASNSPARGVREMEVYNNTWSAGSSSWTAMELRGGTGMVFGNTAAAGNLVLHEYGATATWPNFSNTLQTYPVDDQIGIGKDPKAAASEPMYLWGNTRAGINWHINLGYGEEATLGSVIMADRDYYTATTTAFNGTSGVGSSTLALRPATCTTGVGYFATDQGSSWNAQNGTSSDGTLYRCTSTNTWTESYTPYALPHYLTATSTIGTNTVDIGSGARMFGNGRFYRMSTTTASGVFADIAVTPGTGEETWVDLSISGWANSGTRHKTWIESMPHLNSTSTVHVIGDLAANETYSVKVDGVTGASITGGSCTSGICTSDGSGKITFTYSGGYSEHQFDVEQSSPDTTPPVISSIASSTAATTATITWTTDESSTSTVSYGATSSYGSASTSASLVTLHSIVITGLSTSTLYHFQVGSADASGNVATSSDLTFTTAGPTVTTATVTIQSASSVSASTAILNGTVTNDGSASSTVHGFHYGLTSTYGSTLSTTTSFGIGAFNSTATGLTPNTTYHYEAFATNSVGTASSTDQTFTTLAIAPTVTVQAASSITTSTAVLNGTVTDEGYASTTVHGFEYGLTTSYGTVLSTGGTFGVGTFNNTASSLTASTLYHFRAFAHNSAGTSTSADLTFTTSAVPDTTAPVISSIASSTSDTTGTVTWTTDEAATSQVEYGASSTYSASTTLDSSLVTSHSVTISGLTATSTYHFRILTKDSSNNLATSTDKTLNTTDTPISTTPPVDPQLNPGAPSGGGGRRGQRFCLECRHNCRNSTGMLARISL